LIDSCDLRQSVCVNVMSMTPSLHSVQLGTTVTAGKLGVFPIELCSLSKVHYFAHPSFTLISFFLIQFLSYFNHQQRDREVRLAPFQHAIMLTIVRSHRRVLPCSVWVIWAANVTLATCHLFIVLACGRYHSNRLIDCFRSSQVSLF
jgi:hypothetical protein